MQVDTPSDAEELGNVHPDVVEKPVGEVVLNEDVGAIAGDTAAVCYAHAAASATTEAACKDALRKEPATDARDEATLCYFHAISAVTTEAERKSAHMTLLKCQLLGLP